MKNIRLYFIAFTFFILAECCTSKKNTVTTTNTTTTTNTNTPTPPPNNGSGFPFAFNMIPSDVIAPRPEELTALQVKYADVTMQTLNDGHALYIGVCTSCHLANSIYSISEDSWPRILNDMTDKAQITSVQKDAVNKYFLSIKATQPK